MEFRLCAIFWNVKHKITSLENVGWGSEWQQFINRRGGRLPYWMQKIAQRLDFQFPIT